MKNIYKKIGIGISTAAIMAASFVLPAAAASTTYTPFTFIGTAADCGNVGPAGTPGGASATQNSNGSVTLTKSDPTNGCSAAGVDINNAPTSVISLSFDVNGYCGAGAPRFNVYTSSTTYFFGCTYGQSGGTATFTAGNTYGGVTFPAGGITGVTGIQIIQDETGSTTLSNITVNGQTVSYSNAPTTKDQCKNGGWQTSTDLNGNSFKNQGQCVSYFNHISHK
jgi:hypothetical protein